MLFSPPSPLPFLTSLNPLDWFELRLKITVFVELYIEAGVKIFGEFVGYRASWEFSIVVFDQTYVPDPFDPIAQFDKKKKKIDFTKQISSGGRIICQSMAASTDGELL